MFHTASSLGGPHSTLPFVASGGWLQNVLFVHVQEIFILLVLLI